VVALIITSGSVFDLIVDADQGIFDTINYFYIDIAFCITV